MSKLKPLICPNCAGRVDRDTLTCDMCGLQFQMDSMEQLHIVELRRGNFRTLAGKVITDPYLLQDPEVREQVTEHVIRDMAHKMAMQMLPLIEFQTEYNPDFKAFVTYGRVRVMEPDNHPDINFDTFWGDKM